MDVARGVNLAPEHVVEWEHLVECNRRCVKRDTEANNVQRFD